MKKKLLLILIPLVILVGFFLIRKSRASSSSFAVQSVSLGQMDVSTSASGEIRAEKDTTLTFQTLGLLSWIGFKKGDSVKKGQAVAALDKRDLEKRFKKEMNDYLTTRWDFEQTQDDYKETKDNFLVTDEIKRILDQNQFTLDNSVLDVEIADLAVRFATLYAPFGGILVEETVPDAGVNVTPLTAKFRIVDPTSVYFDALIDETDIAKVKVGDRVKVSLDAYPDETIEGVVEKIGFDFTLTSGGGTAYGAHISLPSDGKVYRLGMNGDVEIIHQSIDNALLVPLSSLSEKEGKTYVWKVEDGKAKRVEISIDNINDDYARVVGGLSAGERVVSSNISLVKEGMAIKP